MNKLVKLTDRRGHPLYLSVDVKLHSVQVHSSEAIDGKMVNCPGYTVIETERDLYKVTESPDDVYSAIELVRVAEHDLKAARLEIEQRRERDLLELERLR